MKLKIIIVLMVFIMSALYNLIGLFVIQPIGMLSDGATVVYWRYETNLDFVESADGFLIKKDIPLSLMSRAMTLGAIGSKIQDYTLFKLPYSHDLYLYTTKGQEFSQ